MKSKAMICMSAAGLIIGCNRATVEEASRAFNETPAPVQETVRNRAPNAEVARVDKQTRDGIAIYRIEFRDAQRHPPMEIAADGTVTKYQAGSVALGRLTAQPEEQKGSGTRGGDFSALPLKVQEAIAEHAPKAAVSDLRRFEENGRVMYEVQYAGQGTNPVLRVAVDGTVLKRPE